VLPEVEVGRRVVGVDVIRPGYEVEIKKLTVDKDAIDNMARKTIRFIKHFFGVDEVLPIEYC
jgi:hypothetical protein